ncbi:MAG: LPP20 family lipoprotein [Marinilabilia sp.]
MARQYTFLFAALLLILSSIPADAAKPKWVKKRPSERDHYIGIGMAGKDNHEGLDYARKARADALKELASEIEVNVSSNSLLRQFENNYEFQETYESEIATSANNNLKGYEVQTWENKREYWVMMRLDKEKHRRRKRQDLEMAKKQAASHFLDARQHADDHKITPALAAYFKSIESLEDHLKEDLTYRSMEGEINFATDIMKDLRDLFSKISVTPENPELKIVFSKQMEAPLEAKVEYFTPDGEKIPVQSLPVNFSFIEGEGLLREKNSTNASGVVTSHIQKLESSRKKQQVKVVFDHTDLLKEENIESPLVAFFLPDETIPSATFNIELQKSDAFFQGRESTFGRENQQQPFSNQLKAKLNETYFNFTDAPGEAEYIVKTEVAFKKGEIKEGTGYSVYLVFADLYFSVLAGENKREIFSDAITEVKGMRAGGYDYALKEARNKLLDRFREEVYPQLEKLNF